MQQDSTAALPSTCFIHRRTLTSDSAGGSSESYVATTAQPIPCEIIPGGGVSEVERAGRVASETYYQVILPAGTDIVETDRIVADTLTLEVISINSPSYLVATKVGAIKVL